MSALKKSLLVAAALACALALGACSSSGSASSPAASGSASASSASASASSASASASASSASAAASSASSEAASQSAASAAAAPAEKGVYENEYFNIAFEAPEGWLVQDASQNPTVNSNLAALSGDAQIIMVAAPTDGSSNGVILAREETTEANANATAEERVKADAEKDKAGMEEVGVTVELADATITIGDEQVPAIEYIITPAGGGTPSYSLQACKKGADNDFLFIAIVGENDAAVSDLVTHFSAFAK